MRLLPALLALAFLIPAGRALAEDPPGDAPKAEAPKSGASKEAPAKKKGGKKKPKGFDYERSKYKSRDLSETTQNAYKWNDKGEILSGDGAVKKTAAPKKKKKRSEPTEEEIREKAESCGEDSCGEKKPSEADAL